MPTNKAVVMCENVVKERTTVLRCVPSFHTAMKALSAVPSLRVFIDRILFCFLFVLLSIIVTNNEYYYILIVRCFNISRL